jgi:two-component system, NtrC family, sensor histidine kinase PilS
MAATAEQSTIVSTSAPGELAWRVLILLNIYRLLVPAILIVLHYSMPTGSSAGAGRPALFVATAAAYLAFAIVAILPLKKRWPDLERQAWIHVVVDVIAISLLLYFGGGAASGLGMLLIVPVGSVSLLVGGRRALVIASGATLALLLQEGLWQITTGMPGDYTAAGLLGAVLFVTAGGLYPLADRLRESEALVRQKEVDLANMAELSQYIVQHLRESILVVDAGDRIRLINESAAQILGDRTAVPGALLGEVSARLRYFLSTWRRNPHPNPAQTQPASFVAADGTRMMQPHFAPLGSQNPGPVLIFLEDLSLLAEHLQQSKLAALGRLSASIAHEIRNPVGAMSHAGQLLGESPQLGEQEKRLTEIIRLNGDRVSTIINNVLQLSRRDSTRPERLTLFDWLTEFRSEFCQTTQTPPGALTLGQDTPDVEIRVDSSHLHQVVWNLCDNALKFTAVAGVPAKVELRCGRVAATGRPYLEVADRGPGIDADTADRIFEPFFTSRSGGTGLGLFIARELCQCNGAILLHEPRPGGGSIFRVIFADPRRWEAPVGVLRS